MTIFIGSPAISGDDSLTSGATDINLNNPALYDGSINSIEVWARENLTGFRVGVFFLVSGTVFQCRDSVTIGNVIAGSKQTFPVSLAVKAGDYIGCYYATGRIASTYGGGIGRRRKGGEFIDPGDSADFTTFYATQGGMSLYGIGMETEIVVENIAYVVPPITDWHIKPDTRISTSYISNQVSIAGCPGEFVPASFVIYSRAGLQSLLVTPSNFVAKNGAILPASNVDIRVVKCWWQGATGQYSRYPKCFVPELLLKDDSLIDVRGEENYIKLTNGEYRWISEPKEQAKITWGPPISEFPVKDSDTLQPVNIPAGTNKQFWITVKIPETADAGLYSSQISLDTPAIDDDYLKFLGTIGVINLQLEVYPIELAPPRITYSIYYFSTLVDGGTISSYGKNATQLTAELENLKNHGITNPMCIQDVRTPMGHQHLEIRRELGMLAGQPFYSWIDGLVGGNGTGSSQDPAVLAALTEETKQFVALLKSYGTSELYRYGVDESDLSTQRLAFQAVHNGGAKSFVAAYGTAPNAFTQAGDLLDLIIFHDTPIYGVYYSIPEETAKWHSVGHKMFLYAYPQLIHEWPGTYRRKNGLYAWQNDLDGMMDFAYQWSRGDNIYNDFDCIKFRDFGIYPTINGIIDTCAWEGFREGITDMRYLATLLNTIEAGEAKGINISNAEAYINSLKTTDLSTVDLNQVRREMVSHILYIQGQISGVEPLPPISPEIMSSVMYILAFGILAVFLGNITKGLTKGE